MTLYTPCDRALLVGVRTSLSVLASSLLGFVLLVAVAVGVFSTPLLGQCWEGVG